MSVIIDPRRHDAVLFDLDDPGSLDGRLRAAGVRFAHSNAADLVATADRLTVRPGRCTVVTGTDAGVALKNYTGSIVYGSGLPSDIWQAAMDGALDGQPIEQFPEPAAIGGVAGVPYEAPETTEAPTRTRRNEETTEAPSPTTTFAPPSATLAPGVTIPLPGPPTETVVTPTPEANGNDPFQNGG